MKRITISLLLILNTLLYVISAKAQWYEVSFNLPSEWSAGKMDAIDSLTAIGPLNYDSIYITTDGGLSWNSIYQPIGWVVDIAMVTAQKIWLCRCGFPEIYATSDGGNNWQLQFDDTSLTNCINYIEMFDSLNGVAMGDAPSEDKPALFLRTTDGGNNWISMNQNNLIGLSSGDLWRRVDFVNINTGYFYSFGESPHRLYKTTNGGTDWEVVNDTIDYVQVIKFYDENFGLVYPSPNGIYKTTDGGTTWEDITIPPGHRSWVSDIEFAPSNPSKIWFATNGAIFLSTDYGITWTEQTYTDDMQFYDLIFTDDASGWLIGNNVNYPPLYPYYIYKTTNGGVGGIVSVEDIRSNSMVGDFNLGHNYPNPFNPSTKIRYKIPELSFITLRVYDVLGNELETLVNEDKPTGTYEITWYAEDLPSGIYFYKLQAGYFVETKKMVLMK